MLDLRRHALVLALCAAAPAYAQSVPGTITFAARLVDSDAPVQGARTLSFRLYSEPTGGNPLWSEEHMATVENGFVSVLLGSTTSLDPGVLNGAPLFLEVTVGGTTLAPRMSVVSVPYAIRAGLADSADSLGSLTESDVVTGVTVGTGLITTRTGNSVNVAVNPTALQLRIRGICNEGEAVRTISEDGTLFCGPFNIGDITGVTAGAGLAGGGITGDAPLSIMPCAEDEVLRSTGTGWTCSTDRTDGDITSVVAGNGLTGGGTVGAASLSLMSCAAGLSLVSTSSGWTCGGQFTGAADRLVRFTSANGGVSGSIYDDGTNLGLGGAIGTYKITLHGETFINGGWLRIGGNTGVYFETHGGGWHMTDTSSVRVFGGKNVWSGRQRTDTGFADAQYIAERTGGNILPGFAIHLPGVSAVQLLGNTDGTLHVVNNTGNAFAPVRASAFNTTSDITLKKDVVTLDGAEFQKALQSIRDIQSIRYRYLHEKANRDDVKPLDGSFWREHPHLGVAAHTLPLEVRVPMSRSPASGGKEDVLGVSLADMDGLLVAGVKGLDDELTRLKAQLAARDRTIADLEKRLSRLEAAR